MAKLFILNKEHIQNNTRPTNKLGSKPEITQTPSNASKVTSPISIKNDKKGHKLYLILSLLILAEHIALLYYFWR